MITLCSRLICGISAKQFNLRNCIKSSLLKSQVYYYAPTPSIMYSNEAKSDKPIGSVKKQAELGFKSGGENYDTNRPGYTDESVCLVASEIESTLKSVSKTNLKFDVLELGAGTGKMTEQLSKKLPQDTRYLATDQSENFLDVLKSKGLNVSVQVATADKIPLENNSVGNIVCAQCFHWFAEKENLDSIHRVLVPGGKLILIWNMKRFEHEWLKIFYEQRKEVVKKVDGSMKYLVNTMEWKKDIDVSTDFKFLSCRSLAGINYHGDLETILANITTISAYNALPVEERNAYVDKLRQALKNWPGLDTTNIIVPFTTELYIYVAQ